MEFTPFCYGADTLFSVFNLVQISFICIAPFTIKLSLPEPELPGKDGGQEKQEETLSRTMLIRRNHPARLRKKERGTQDRWNKREKEKQIYKHSKHNGHNTYINIITVFVLPHPGWNGV